MTMAGTETILIVSALYRDLRLALIGFYDTPKPRSVLYTIIALVKDGQQHNLEAMGFGSTVRKLIVLR